MLPILPSRLLSRFNGDKQQYGRAFTVRKEATSMDVLALVSSQSEFFARQDFDDLLEFKLQEGSR
jgi:hypothetical protein